MYMCIVYTVYTTRQVPQASQCIPSTHHHLLTDFSHHYHTIDLFLKQIPIWQQKFVSFPYFPFKSLQNKSLLALHIEMDPTIP